MPACNRCSRITQRSIGGESLCEACLLDEALSAGSPLAGEDFDPYEILCEVGAGGLGVVYLAQQLRPVRREVALKAVKELAAPAEVRARFETERQSLAILNHPNIAQMYDAGTSSAGRPYIVMEFVEGTPLTDYCATNSLTIRDRVVLMVEVCQGVEYAHRKGILHRDLKPSNVLISESGGRPAPKIIDFGIAKALPGAGGGESRQTVAGVFLGTVEYISPEQARSAGEIGPASDVYSLGVLLYELLAGALPFDSARLREAGPLGTMRILSEEEAPSLGDALKRSADPGALAGSRKASLPQLERQLSGDLEHIVRKTLQIEPGERYSSAGDLAADLKRYLANEPVLAHPAGPLYRVRKLISRRSGATTAISGAVLLLAAVALMVFRDRAGPPPVPIRSIAVMPFQTIGQSPGDDDLLSLGLADIIATRLGKTGKILVTPTEAIRRYTEKGADALTAAHSLHTESVLTGALQESGDRVRVTVQLLRSKDGRTLWADEFEEQKANIFALQDAISAQLTDFLALKLAGAEKVRVAHNGTENWEAYELFLKGRYYWAKRTPDSVQKAIRSFNDALALDANYAQAYAGLADSYALTASGLAPEQRIAKARQAAQRALALDPDLADSQASLAFITYKFDWNWREAESHFRRAIQLSPSYAIAHHWFGEFLVLVGRFDEGIAELREAERLDPLSLSIQADLARGLYRARRYDDSIAQAQRALELDATFSNAFAILTHDYEMKGMYPQAMDSDLQVLRLENYSQAELDRLRRAFAASGWKGYWTQELALMRERAKTSYIPIYEFAEANVRTGNADAAFQAIGRSFQEHGDGPLEIKVEPLLDPIRADSRFAELLARAGFQ